MLGLLKHWRRSRLLKKPVPREWVFYLEKNVPFYFDLTGGQRKRFFERIKIFLGEKEFYGAGGLTLTEEMRVVVAAAAVRLILYLDIGYYDRLAEILVYPTDYVHPEYDEIRSGEYHQWGTVVLSWETVLEDLRHPRDGRNTAFHEFAHVLDRNTGAFDGTPQLHSPDHVQSWADIMSRHYLKLMDDVEEEQLNVLDPYGSENEAEFFAVATEAFFETPQEIQRNMPDLYSQFVRFYKFDPVRNEGVNLRLEEGPFT